MITIVDGLQIMIMFGTLILAIIAVTKKSNLPFRR